MRANNLTPCLAAIAIGCGLPPEVTPLDDALSAQASTPPRIARIEWSGSSYAYGAIGSDLWPVTWTADDQVLAGWGDGAGFGPTPSQNLNGGPGRVSWGFSTIDGNPPGLTYSNIWGGYHATHPSTFGGKGGSIVAAGSSMYWSIYCYWASNTSSGCPSNGSGGDLVSDSIGYSTDQGATWSKSSWSFLDMGFASPISFIEFGKNNGSVPALLGGSGYLFGYVDDSAGKFYLLRAPANEAMNQSAYQILIGVGANNTPIWSSNMSDRQYPAGPGSVLGNLVIYDPGLQTYVASGNGNDCGQVAFFQAPQPWGPWTQFANYANWPNEDVTPNDLTTLHGANQDGTGDGFSIVPKWISGDGLTFWVIWACYGSGDYSADGSYHDRFNLIQGKFVLAGSGGTDAGTPTPLAHWKLDEGKGTVTSDSSGHGNTGTLVGGTAWTTGKYGDAVAFDGTDNQYVDFGDAVDLRLTGSMTVSAWFKAKAFSTVADMPIVSKRSPGERGWQLYTDGPNYAFDVAVNSSTYQVLYGNTNLSPGVWYHAVGVYDATAKRLTVYTNGVEDGTMAVSSGAQYNSSHDVHVGNSAGCTTSCPYHQLFDGVIDEVQIFGEALTAAQVRALP
jgi:hypothetical protein